LFDLNPTNKFYNYFFNLKFACNPLLFQTTEPLLPFIRLIGRNGRSLRMYLSG